MKITLSRRFREIGIEELGVLLLALAGISAFFVAHRVPFASLEHDGVFALEVARNLGNPNQPVSTCWPLGYPAAIRLLNYLVGGWFTAAKLVSTISGIGFLIVSYLLVLELANRKVALLAGTLLATSLLFIAYSAMAMSDMLGAFLPLLAIYIIVKARTSQSVGMMAMAGTLLGLGWLVRYVNMAFLPLCLLPLLPGLWSRHRISASLGAIAGAIVAAIPQFVYNNATFGSALYSDNWRLIAGIVLGSGPSHAYGSFGHLLLSEPIETAKFGARGLLFATPWQLMRPAGWALLFACPGLLCWALNTRARVSIWIVAAILYASATSFRIGLSNPELRYLLFLLPLVYAGAAYTVVWMFGHHKNVLIWTVCGLLMSNVGGIAWNLPDYFQEQAPEYRRAGTYLQQHTAPDSFLLASQLHIGYYAGRRMELLEQVSPRSPTELEAIVERLGVDYVIMDERYGAVDGHLPGLRYLFDSTRVYALHPGWRLVYEDHVGPKLVIWQTAMSDEQD